MIPFNIADWYWQVGDDTSQFYSSKKPGFVLSNDPGFEAFRRDGAPPRVDTINDLVTLFMAQYPAGMLVTYADAVARTKAAAGYTTTVAQQQVTFRTDDGSLAFMTGKAVRLSRPDAPASVNWRTGLTTFVNITTADFLGIATEVADFVQGIYDKLDETLGQIASGQIATIAQIDQAFA